MSSSSSCRLAKVDFTEDAERHFYPEFHPAGPDGSFLTRIACTVATGPLKTRIYEAEGIGRCI
jgi:hypothetical protein